MTKKCIVCGDLHTDDSAMYDYSDGLWCMRCDDKYYVAYSKEHPFGEILRVQSDKPVPKYKVRNWNKYKIINEKAFHRSVEILAGHRN